MTRKGRVRAARDLIRKSGAPDRAEIIRWIGRIWEDEPDECHRRWGTMLAQLNQTSRSRLVIASRRQLRERSRGEHGAPFVTFSFREYCEQAIAIRALAIMSLVIIDWFHLVFSSRSCHERQRVNMCKCHMTRFPFLAVPDHRLRCFRCHGTYRR